MGFWYNNSLKIPKWLLEVENRRSYNTMTKMKKDKRTNNGLENITQKTKD
jgi:hypothetical protein